MLTEHDPVMADLRRHLDEADRLFSRVDHVDERTAEITDEIINGSASRFSSVIACMWDYEQVDPILHALTIAVHAGNDEATLAEEQRLGKHLIESVRGYARMLAEDERPEEDYGEVAL